MSEKTLTQKIARTQTIQQVFNLFPDSAQELAGVMTRHGLHCVGCHASVFETLEQGILGHGFPEEKLEQMVQELNEVVSKEKPSYKISITKLAASKIKEMLTAENKESWGLRFGLKDPSTFEYELAFRENPEAQELTFETEGIPVYVSRFHISRLTKSTIDYTEGDEGTGFKIENPNEL